MVEDKRGNNQRRTSVPSALRSRHVNPLVAASSSTRNSAVATFCLMCTFTLVQVSVLRNSGLLSSGTWGMYPTQNCAERSQLFVLPTQTQIGAPLRPCAHVPSQCSPTHIGYAPAGTPSHACLNNLPYCMPPPYFSSPRLCPIGFQCSSSGCCRRAATIQAQTGSMNLKVTEEVPETNAKRDTSISNVCETFGQKDLGTLSSKTLLLIGNWSFSSLSCTKTVFVACNARSIAVVEHVCNCKKIFQKLSQHMPLVSATKSAHCSCVVIMFRALGCGPQSVLITYARRISLSSSQSKAGRRANSVSETGETGAVIIGTSGTATGALVRSIMLSHLEHIIECRQELTKKKADKNYKKK